MRHPRYTRGTPGVNGQKIVQDYFVQEVGETAAKKFKKGDRVAVDPNR
jgi:hypothetical protein